MSCTVCRYLLVKCYSSCNLQVSCKWQATSVLRATGPSNNSLIVRKQTVLQNDISCLIRVGVGRKSLETKMRSWWSFQGIVNKSAIFYYILLPLSIYILNDFSFPSSSAITPTAPGSSPSWRKPRRGPCKKNWLRTLISFHYWKKKLEVTSLKTLSSSKRCSTFSELR